MGKEIAVKSEFDHIRDALVGMRVVAVSDDSTTLILEDNSRLVLWESESDCCAVARGEWQLSGSHLDAMITNVTLVKNFSGPDANNESVSEAEITILYQDNVIASAMCMATDGNAGYYLSTLTLTAFLSDQKRVFDVVSCPED